jgi:hypothetical protein
MSSTGTLPMYEYARGTEAQLAGVRGEADIDRQHPELAKHLQHALLGRDRQRDKEKIDARLAREFDKIIDRAEFRLARDHGSRTVVASIVEHATDVEIRIFLRLKRFDQHFTGRGTADNHGAANEPAFAGPAANFGRDEQTECKQRGKAGEVPACGPHARVEPFQTEEKLKRKGEQEDRSPCER